VEGGNHEAFGKSGERGALQYQESTWKLWSKDVAGRVLPFTEENEYYVAYNKVENWIKQGYSDRQISLIWNQGHAGACKAGTNGYGVAYDSCAYARQVLARL